MKPKILGLMTCAVIALPTACFAQEMVSAEQVAGGKMAILLKPGLSNATMSISGPNNFHASTQSKGGALAIDLAQFGPYDDGTYTYQVTASTGEKQIVRTSLDNGRDREAQALKSVAASGTFNVVKGKIVRPDPSIKEGKR